MKKKIAMIMVAVALAVTGCSAVDTGNNEGTKISTSITDETNSNEGADSGTVNADNQADKQENSQTSSQENNQEDNQKNDGETVGNSTESNVNTNTDNTSVEINTDPTTTTNAETGEIKDFTAFGHYVDKQGTSDIYSEIFIQPSDSGEISVEIGIFRLSTFYGTGTPTDDPNKIIFYEEERGIRGIIECSSTGAVFTVTESDWGLLHVDDSFVFDEVMGE